MGVSGWVLALIPKSPKNVKKMVWWVGLKMNGWVWWMGLTIEWVGLVGG